MPTKKHTVEQIIEKLREVEKLTGQGMTIPQAAKRSSPWNCQPSSEYLTRTRSNSSTSGA